MPPEKPHILCVDHESCCEMLYLMLNLEKPRYELIGVNSAEKALEIIAINKFDLYLLECRLQKLSGVELCRRIRENDKETPILFYSVRARPIDRSRAMAAGASAYLVKPNDIDKLQETIERLVHKDSKVSKSKFDKNDGVYRGIY